MTSIQQSCWTLTVVKLVKKFPSFCGTQKVCHDHSSLPLDLICIQMQCTPSHHIALMSSLLLSSCLCTDICSNLVSLSFLTKILYSYFVLVINYDTEGKFHVQMCRCYVADGANSTFFLPNFVCGLCVRLYSLVLSSAQVTFTSVHTFPYSGVRVMPWCEYLVIGLSVWRPMFSPRPVHVAFVVIERLFSEYFWLSPVCIIPPILHAYSFIYLLVMLYNHCS